MKHHGFDAENHPFITKEPDVILSQKKKRKAVTVTDKNLTEDVAETDNDSNENSFYFSEDEMNPELVESKRKKKKRAKRHDEDHDDTERSDGKGDTAATVLSPFEQIREHNIREKEEFMKRAGLIPHSEEINMG